MNFRPLLVLSMVLPLLYCVPPAPAAPPGAQPPAAPTPAPAAWWGTVTSNDVYLRSAPSVESSYPYATFGKGTVVRVEEESFGWGRVAAVGPAFRELFGYIKADRRVRLADDGRSAEVTARTDVLAPNLAARYSPDTSWKAIARLEPGTTVTVTGTVEGQREIVYRIPLPADAEGWINLSFLRRATAEEIAVVDPSARPTPPPTEQPRRPTDRPDASPPRDATPSTTASSTPGVRADDRAAAAERAEEAREDVIATEADATTEPPADPPPAPEPPRIRLSDLERAFERLLREDPATAEVTAMRARYLAFADETESAGEREFARGRAEQLAMRETVQERLQQARRLRSRSDVDLETIRSTRIAMDARQGYAAVGSLNASRVFDGVRLPLLYRLQDPSGGQTIAYLQPGKDAHDFDLSTLLGQLVGIVGTRTYDEGLRVNLIVPTRIDILTGVR